MINQEKVKKMTRAAILESGNGGKLLNIARYRRADYITVQLLLSFLSGTCCYAAVVLILITAFWSGLDTTLAAGGIRGLIRVLIVLYIIFIILYLLFSGIIAWKRYLHSHELTEIYLQALDEIEKSEEPPESAGAPGEETEEEKDGTASEN